MNTPAALFAGLLGLSLAACGGLAYIARPRRKKKTAMTVITCVEDLRRPGSVRAVAAAVLHAPDDEPVDDDAADLLMLLLEEDPLLRSAITRELTEQGVPADRIHYHSHPNHERSGLLALLQQQAPRVAKSARMGSRTEPVARSSQSPQVPPSSLCCALCAAPVAWLPGLGVQACSACGSQLFRAEPPVR